MTQIDKNQKLILKLLPAVTSNPDSQDKQKCENHSSPSVKTPQLTTTI